MFMDWRTSLEDTTVLWFARVPPVVRGLISKAMALRDGILMGEEVRRKEFLRMR